MALKINKRQQARNERALQDLIKDIPGNDRCADCFARNPGWASWNLGIFLCMRCAALHRKLGTHVSKVKSLSMDTWSLEQVESIKQKGNAASNRQYNPKNAKPTIPVDADEVDGAMERYIREKYISRALSDEKPVQSPGTRHHTGSSSGSSSDVPPPLPPKPNQRFGANIRSFTTPVMRADAPLPSPPASIKTDRTGASSGGTRVMARIPETESSSTRGSFEYELRNLKDMGFNDERQNMAILQNFNGNIEKTVETLTKLRSGFEGQANSTARTITNGITFEEPQSQINSTTTNGTSYEKPPSQSGVSSNPFLVSRDRPRASSNPQQLESSFQSMHISNQNQPQTNPGYVMNQHLNQSFQGILNHKPMTPPVLQPHSSYSSPPRSVGSSSPQLQYPPDFANQNYPLRQSRSQQNFSGANPYAQNMTNGGFQTMQPTQQHQLSNQVSQWPQQTNVQQQGYQYQFQQQQPTAPQPNVQTALPQNLYQSQSTNSSPMTSPPPVQNNPFNAPQQQQQQQQQFSHNPYLSSNGVSNMQQQNGLQNQYYPQYTGLPQQQPQPLRPQVTGLNKASILALYNTPSPTIPQSSDSYMQSNTSMTNPPPQPIYNQQPQSQTQQQYTQNQPQSPQQVYQPSPTQFQPQPQSQTEFRPVPIQARSATMPLPAPITNQNGSIGNSNNPFVGRGHVSRESMLFTSAGADMSRGGRTSPDAFSGLSARVGWAT